MPNDALMLKLKGLCDECKVVRTHAYVFARLQSILTGTPHEFLIKGVEMCKDEKTLQKFVYNVYLACCGLSNRNAAITPHKTRSEKDKEQDAFESGMQKLDVLLRFENPFRRN
jgi:hypothetical protein